MKDVVCVGREVSLASQVASYMSSVFCRREIDRTPLIMKSHFDFSATPLLKSNHAKREKVEGGRGEREARVNGAGDAKMEGEEIENGFSREKERGLFGLDSPIVAKWYAIEPHYVGVGEEGERRERRERRRPMGGEYTVTMSLRDTLPLCDVAPTLAARARSHTARGIFFPFSSFSPPSSPLSPPSPFSPSSFLSSIDIDSTEALMSSLIHASDCPDDVSRLFSSPSLSPLLCPFGPYDVATFCSLSPQAPCCSVRYGEAGACAGMTSSSYGTLTWLLVRSGTVRVWIVPSRQDVVQMYEMIGCREMSGFFFPPHDLYYFSAKGMTLWEVVLSAGDTLVMPASMHYQYLFERPPRSKSASHTSLSRAPSLSSFLTDMRDSSSVSSFGCVVTTSFTHICNVHLEEERERDARLYGHISHCDARIAPALSWRAVVCTAVYALAVHLEDRLKREREREKEKEHDAADAAACDHSAKKRKVVTDPEPKIANWCRCDRALNSCGDRLTWLQPLFSSVLAEEAACHKDLALSKIAPARSLSLSLSLSLPSARKRGDRHAERKRKQRDAVVTPDEEEMTLQLRHPRRCEVCGASLFNTFFVCGLCNPRDSLYPQSFGGGRVNGKTAKRKRDNDSNECDDGVLMCGSCAHTHPCQALTHCSSLSLSSLEALLVCVNECIRSFGKHSKIDTLDPEEFDENTRRPRIEIEGEEGEEDREREKGKEGESLLVQTDEMVGEGVEGEERGRGGEGEEGDLDMFDGSGVSYSFLSENESRVYHYYPQTPPLCVDDGQAHSSHTPHSNPLSSFPLSSSSSSSLSSSPSSSTVKFEAKTTFLGSRAPAPSFSLPGWSCHRCLSIHSMSLSCSRDPFHRWCSPCLRTMGWEYSTILASQSEYWPLGCPACVGSCSCLCCRTLWKTLIPSQIVIHEDIPISVRMDNMRMQMYHEDVPFSVSQHPTGCHVVKYVDPSEWSRDDFIEVVLQRQTPVVLRGFASEWDPEMWNMEYLRRRGGGGTLWVRYQGIHPDHTGPFTVLKDQKKRVAWFIDLLHGRVDPAMDDPDYEWKSDSTEPSSRHSTLFHTSEVPHRNGDHVVVYAKDFLFQNVLPEWDRYMRSKLPSYLVPEGDEDMIRYLPPKQRPITLMAYIGSTHTRTPMHVDRLNTVAYNTHVVGAGVKKWWMVDARDKAKLERLIQEQTGGNGHLYGDNVWVDPAMMERSGIRLWVVEQRRGDMVIVPPGVPHQVLNYGGHSLAVAANVMNEYTLHLNWAMECNYRRLHVDSVYRLKTLVYFGLQEELKQVARLSLSLDGNTHETERENGHCEHAQSFLGKPIQKPSRLLSRSRIRLMRLAAIFHEVIKEEQIPGISDDYMGTPCRDEALHTRTCDYCRADIFNRRYHCFECGCDGAEGVDLCIQCYRSEDGLNKSERHSHRMELVQVVPLAKLKSLVEEAEEAVERLKDFDE